jgi:hypothetical protein
LLGKDGLEFHVPDCGPGQHPEVPGRDAPGEETALREGEGHIPHLQALEELAVSALVKGLEPVGSGKLPGLIIVHIQKHPIRNGPCGLDTQQHVRLKLGNQAGVAGHLHPGIAGPESGPISSELPSGLNPEGQVPVVFPGKPTSQSRIVGQGIRRWEEGEGVCRARNGVRRTTEEDQEGQEEGGIHGDLIQARSWAGDRSRPTWVGDRSRPTWVAFRLEEWHRSQRAPDPASPPA